MGADHVAELLRRDRVRLVESWEREVRRGVPCELAPDRPVLRTHAYELIGGLASWLEGATDHADDAFTTIVDSPELHALGYAAGLEALTGELAALRATIARALSAQVADLAPLHAAIDRAMVRATSRFVELREEVRTRFIGILGHDLRDPINTVTITARLLGRHPKLRAHATRIEDSCERMMRMVDDVLDFARGHLGSGIPARPAPNDLGDICSAAADELAIVNPARPIEVQLHGDLRATVDRDRVAQAIVNLLSNAIQHGRGPIELAVHETDDRAAVVTAVTSHGSPIPSSELARIFDPFARMGADSPTSGLGLGLYIVEQIARAHDAHCDVSSTPAGTTFAIRWPRAHVVAHRRAG
jgi:signal transduction histidine kinase